MRERDFRSEAVRGCAVRLPPACRSWKVSCSEDSQVLPDTTLPGSFVFHLLLLWHAYSFLRFGEWPCHPYFQDNVLLPEQLHQHQSETCSLLNTPVSTVHRASWLQICNLGEERTATINAWTGGMPALFCDFFFHFYFLNSRFIKPLDLNCNYKMAFLAFSQSCGSTDHYPNMLHNLHWIPFGCSYGQCNCSHIQGLHEKWKCLVYSRKHERRRQSITLRAARKQSRKAQSAALFWCACKFLHTHSRGCWKI